MFEKNFCPSPWFHMRINNTGHYEYCRWMVKDIRGNDDGLAKVSPIYWFQQNLSPIRKNILDGQLPEGCSECLTMESHGKASGRQRQLLKIGTDVEQFNKSILSSPWLNVFKQSQSNQGTTDQWPQDWQIDLGNYCNSACVFCTPFSSSRLATEFQSLGLISELPPRSWCDDPKLLEQFLEVIAQSPRITYLHFIGGETLITPGFAKILQKLIDSNLNKQVTIGFTTNLTVWRDDIVELLQQFNVVNLGMSIESLTSLNDYVRYGSNINQVITILHQWLEVARKNSWLVQLRITPTMLTIAHLHELHEFAWRNNIAIESCNFLQRPDFMKPSVLPMSVRNEIALEFKNWISDKSTELSNFVINTRDPNQAKSQVVQDAVSYMNYLQNEPDNSALLPNLVKYLKTLESSRGNSIIDYLPQYENIFRTAGY